MSADIAARGAATGRGAVISERWRRATEAGTGDLLAGDPEVTTPDIPRRSGALRVRRSFAGAEPRKRRRAREPPCRPASRSVGQDVVVPEEQAAATSGGSGDTDQLEREIAALRHENARLKRFLKLTDPEAAPAEGSQAAWFDQAPGLVDAGSPPATKVAFFAALFGARTDVYAIRWENAR